MSAKTSELSRLRSEKRRLQKEIRQAEEKGKDTESLQTEMEELQRQISLITGKDSGEDIRARLEQALAGSPSGPHTKADIEALLNLKYPNGEPIVNLSSPGELVEIIAFVRQYPIEEVLEYLSEVRSPSDVVFNSPLMANARQELKSNQRLLMQEPIAVKGALGRCFRCGNDRLSMSELQTRSGDEAMTIFYLCVTCGNVWKG
jgi:DNA-directed RNA polymerase subunit M/transcription elongation factor TFIIS